MTDDDFMREAMFLAARGRGAVEPNPMVGAVIVRDGVIVGRGWHARFGSAHAEVVALNEAKEKARGATLYSTLEPCCHHGKTPPCTEAILRAGITRVVTAMVDPFGDVSGKGIEKLRASGITVVTGNCDREARWLNRPYLTLLNQRRPYVHLKWAMTLDGKVATATGDSQWISNHKSRSRVHELRGQMDAIIVGAETARRDDPLLTARPPGPRTPARVVVSRHAELPSGSKLLQTASESPVIVATTARGSLPGVEVLTVPSNSKGYPSLHALLSEFGKRRFTNVLVEGGPTLMGSFFDSRLFDEVHVFVAATLAGGAESLTPIAGMGIEKINDALRLARCEMQEMGGDFYLDGWV